MFKLVEFLKTLFIMIVRTIEHRSETLRERTKEDDKLLPVFTVFFYF